MARLGCAQWICGAAVLKSLTGAEMRVSIKTDPDDLCLWLNYADAVHNTAS